MGPLYQINQDGQQFGPYSPDQLRQYFREGRIQQTAMVWTEGMPHWLPLNQAFPDLTTTPKAPPPPVQPRSSKPVRVQTIEKTGKTWKRLKLWSVFGFWGLLIVTFSSLDTPDSTSTISALGAVLCLGLYIYARIGAWWNHG